MREFKKLRESCYVSPSEIRVGPPRGDYAVDSNDVTIYDISKPEIIQRINAFLNGLNRQYIDPNYALRIIHEKLSIIGFKFVYPKNRPYKITYNEQNNSDKEPSAVGSAPNSTYTIGIETERFPLSYLGGRFGVLDDKYTVGTDDGITHKLGKSLMLEINYYVANDGIISVNSKIIMS